MNIHSLLVLKLIHDFPLFRLLFTDDHLFSACGPIHISKATYLVRIRVTQFLPDVRVQLRKREREQAPEKKKDQDRQYLPKRIFEAPRMFCATS